MEKKTNNYLIQVSNLISSFNLNEYKLLNSSYKIGEIIYNLVEDIISNYKLP